MKYIKLTKGFQAIVDDCDFDFINQWTWRIHQSPRGRTIYAKRKKDGMRMHRLLLNLVDPKIEVDHKDGNGLNNQRSNLRTASHAQNASNVLSHVNSTSKFKGVCFRNRIMRGKPYKYWQAQITINKKVIHLGNFNDEIKAAVAYNEAASKAFGEFAKLNKVA